MSSVLLDRTSVPAPSRPIGGRPEGPETGGGGTAARLRAWFAPRRRSAAWLLPLLLVAGLVHRINLAGAPQRIDDEGTYTAQAYAVERFGELAHYTYWYDHPPLGWLQIAGWTSLTQAFDRLEPAVLAGREAMLVAHLVSVALLWVLARRYRLGRPAAAAAVLVYALSPLAVQFHRTVYLDNVATPWLLAAFVFALSTRRQLAAFAGSALCFAMAVLTKETYLLVLPFLAWQMWRSADRDTRRYTLSVAASLFVLAGAAYALFALISSELVPGTNRVSLLQGIAFQLVERTASGSVFDPASLSRRNLDIWLRLDPVLPVAATLAAVAGLWVRRLRPVAAAFLFLLAFMLRPGYLPVPYVIAMLPLAALLVAGVVEAGLCSRRRVLAGAALVGTVVPTVVAAPLWFLDLRGLLLSDEDRPLRQAQAWVVDNVPTDYRVLVDDAIWVDLIEAGFPRENVIWYYKPDTDPEVAGLTPRGWRDYDFVVSTQSLRTFPTGPSSTLGQGLANASVVASFGSGEQRVDVLRVSADGAEAAREREEAQAARRAEAGTALARNPALRIDPGARDLLTGGRVDPRLLVTLAAATATQEMTVADFPGQPGEYDERLPRRSVLIEAVDGRPVSEAGPEVDDLVRFLRRQAGAFAPERVEVRDGVLEVTYDPLAPRRVVAPVPSR
jgi:4-amino-4-deoxy-L-arabinose transferase-like glycosyltransferase